MCTSFSTYLQGIKLSKVCFCYSGAFSSDKLHVNTTVGLSLTWNRFVNHSGEVDAIHPMDLDLEHDNTYFKNDIYIATEGKSQIKVLPE